ncbi:MAG: Holliday junction resolvase-like protein [Thermoplasmatota archaeon]
MNWLLAFWIALAALLLSWLLAAAVFRAQDRRLQAVQAQLEAVSSQKRSQSTRYGQITEQFAPFLAHWPWDPKRFKFLGDPIDGIQFTPEGVIFIEIKTNTSRLSTVQRQVRDHVQAGRVAWREVRLE